MMSNPHLLSKPTAKTGQFVVLFMLLSILLLVGCQSAVSPTPGAPNYSGPQITDAVLTGPGIFFWSDREGKIGWYFMNPDGTNVRRLFLPKLPPGFQITSLKYEASLNGFVVSLADTKEDKNLYVIDAQGKVLSQITKNNLAVGEFDYDPVHRRFAYVCVQFDTDICVANADGSGFANLTKSNSSDGEPRWYPGGNKILFNSNMGGIPDLFSVNPDGSDLQDISKNEHIESGAKFSPDGTKIVMQSQRDGNWNIFTLDADGTNPTNIARDTNAEYEPIWSPDGQFVIFRSLRDNSDDLYIVKRDGTGLKRLTNSPKIMETAYSFSADSQTVLYTEEVNGTGDIFAVKIDGSNAVNLTNNPASDNGAQWIGK